MKCRQLRLSGLPENKGQIKAERLLHVVEARVETDDVFKEMPIGNQDMKRVIKISAKTADPKGLAGAWPGDEQAV